MPRQCPEIFSITCVGVVNSLDRRMRVPSRCSRLRVFSDGPGRRRILLSAPSTRLENRAGDAFRRAIDLATSLKTYTVFEGIEVPVRCWKIGPPTRRPRYMKRLLDALSRVWKLIRILIVLKTVRDFMRDHFDDAR